MAEASSSAESASKQGKWGRRIDELKLVGGAYRGLRRHLEEIKNQPVPQEVLRAYDDNKDVIEDILGRERPNNLFFHGTGNFQYEGEKYKNGTTDNLRHPLDTILENGIQPHHDIWNSQKGGYESSSLATTWPYAKVYADFHQSSGDPLEWEFGDKADWLAYVMAKTALATGKSMAKHGLHHPRQALSTWREGRKNMKENKGDGDLNRLQRWISYVRKPSPHETTREIFHGRTDIQDNFGGVFIINPDGVNLAPKGPGVYEVRTLDVIPPDHFFALAVPMNKVDETRKKVFQRELEIPVIPTEAVDYHMSKFPFDELTRNRRVGVGKLSASR